MISNTHNRVEDTSRLAADTAWAEGDRTSRTLYEAAHHFDRNTLLVADRKRAQIWVRANPFFMAVCLIQPGESPRVFWLSKGEQAAVFAEYGLVGTWTPIGRIGLEVKNAIKDGRVPRTFTVTVPRWSGIKGPVHSVEWQAAGPVVDFALRQGAEQAVIKSAIHWRLENGKCVVEDLTPEVAAALVGIPELPELLPAATRESILVRKSGFGLQDIVGSLDSEQLRNIDFPEDGPLIVTGCAGTGKTTVAFYRAGYLLTEQREARRANPESPVYFSESNMMVLVRKEHLKPYLSGLQKEVGITGVPVLTFDEWFQAQVFRPHVKRGRQPAEPRVQSDSATATQGREFGVRFTSEPHPEWEKWTAVYNEAQLIEYIENEFPTVFAADAAKQCTSFAQEVGNAVGQWSIPTRLNPQRLDAVQQMRTEWVGAFARAAQPRFRYVRETLAYFDGLSGTIERIKTIVETDRDLLGWSSAHRDRIQNWLRRSRELRASILNDTYRFDRIAKHFYQSDASKRALRAAAGEEQAVATTLSDPKRPFHRADEAVLGWLIELFAEGVREAPRHLVPLQRYDHLIVDEAQYYSVLTLRLLQRLARAPRNAITIVGDLEQRFNSAGLSEWVGLVGGHHKDRIKRLNRIYRCSRELYNFLFDLHRVLGLSSTLAEPREVDRFSDRMPDVRQMKSREDEVAWIAEQIDELRSRDAAASIVVVLGARSTQASDFSKLLVRALDELAIPAREAHDEDMRESTDRVMITDSESVVGLEFDYVFVPALDGLWPETLSMDIRRSFWVSVTRAKRYLALTAVGRIPQWLGGRALRSATVRMA